ncbi:Uncharacterised protein [Shewanella algae]|uniref:Uncharacterized protein n=1 Tax=Shewanella algae TaxID=38313 RepID=A0A379Z963_9GAMM|nr:Uncharacterised protein [Shewanella algae]
MNLFFDLNLAAAAVVEPVWLSLPLSLSPLSPSSLYHLQSTLVLSYSA